MEISNELVIAGYAALSAVVGALWRSQREGNRNQLKSQARCEANEARLSKKVDDLDKYQRAEMAEYAEQSAALLATAVPLLDRALRVLRRHEQDHAPTDDALKIRHPSGETTDFIKANK